MRDFNMKITKYIRVDDRGFNSVKEWFFHYLIYWANLLDGIIGILSFGCLFPTFSFSMISKYFRSLKIQK